MQEFSFDLVKNPWPRVILKSDINCRTCLVRSRHVHYKVDTYYFSFYINTSRRIILRFSPAYIGMSKSFLSYLNDEAHLEELYLHGGDSWGNPGVLFPSVKKLRILNLASNGISTFPTENFEAAQNIEELSFAENMLTEIPRGLFTLNNLRNLDLSSNPLSLQNLSSLLYDLPNLKALNISRVSLKVIENLELKLHKTESLLEVLDVSWCGLENLNSDAARRFFQHHSKLQILSLAGNILHNIPSDVFAPLNQLQLLDLSHTNLRERVQLQLAPRISLRLFLAYNNLTSPESILSPENRALIEIMDLSGNPLQPWTNENIFSSVVTLNLSYTGLTYFTESMLNSLRKTKLIDIGGDPIDCRSCYTTVLKDWLRSNTLPQFLLLGQEISLRCVYPLMYRDLTITEVPLSTCQSGNVENSRVVAGVVGGVAGTIVLFFLFLAYYFRLELRYMTHLVRVHRTIAVQRIPQARDFDAFVCYSKSDRGWVVGELLPRLEGCQPPYRLCLHERDFRLGSLIVQNIVECMHRSQHTLIVLTRTFVESQWCQWELEMATHRLLEGSRDFLILVELERLETRSLPRLLRLLRNTRTCLEWPHNSKSNDKRADVDLAFDRLRIALGNPINDTPTS